MTSRAPLTDLKLRKLAPPREGRDEHYDGKVPGFGVRVSAAGTKTFFVLHRSAGGAFRRKSLGRYPELSLADARQQAQAVLSGTGPEKEAGKQTRSASDPFSQSVTAFVEGHCRRRNRESTAKETERLLRTVFEPEWKARPVGDIRKSEVLEVLDRIEAAGTPSAARHAFAAIRKFFNWCLERGLIEASPCMGVRTPGKPSARDNVVSDGALRAIWSGAETIGWPYGPIAQLLMLTAQRRGEVVGMTWDEIDVEKALWSLPGARTKNHRSHVVPLTSRAIALLEALPRVDESPFIFPARGKPDRPYSGYSKGKRELDAVCGLSGWTLHDLRRTAATGMAGAGIAPHVVERLLNHTTGAFGGVAGIYNRFGYLEEMRAALDAWEAHLTRIGVFAA